MRFLFSGFYGFKNIGDDVFCVVADWGGNKFWRSTGNYFVGNNLPKLSNLAHPVYPERNQFPGQRTCSLLAHAAWTDNLVIFGGSTLHSAPARWMNTYYGRAMRSIAGKRVSAVGVSLGPFRTVQDEKAIERFLAKMSFLAVRDQKSYEIAKGMNLETQVVKAFDVALLYPDVISPRGLVEMPVPSATFPTLGVSVCNVERYIGGDLRTESARVKWMIEVLRRVVSEGIKLKFFIFNGDETIGDMTVTQHVINELQLKGNADVVDYNGDTEMFVSNMLTCNAIFGTRLHASILAYAFNLPFLLVEYHRKCSDFLDEIRYERTRRVGDAAVSVEEAAENLRVLIAEPASVRTNLPVEEAREMALRNFLEAPFANV